ncbi:MAG: KR domain-containing protein, partial [Gammaproteobacteria bacterium]|nr:KR domain-containing protein [Gammaproteobacteria bacterium]
AAATEQMFEQISQRFGAVNGIIHTAGVITDAFIMRKTVEQTRQVLLPKVTGTLNLDQASATQPLDFTVLFSSVTGAMGNLGQCDYAYGNAFMDSFSVYRRSLVKKGQRRGKTLSVNWPLWRSGGMQVDEMGEKMLLERMGMAPLESEKGINVLWRGLAQDRPSFGLINGEPEQIRVFLEITESEPTADAIISTVEITAELKEQTEAFLISLLATETKLPEARIFPDEPLESYGIDSVMIISLTGALEKAFGSLSQTIFFENQSLQELQDYLLDKHADKIADYFTNSQADDSGAQNAERAEAENRQYRFPTALKNSDSQNIPQRETGIAIIGMAGRYPQADDPEAFWENLRRGHDSITEIPKERWDHNQYFDSQVGKGGKSYSRWGGFIDRFDSFDPLFFNISPREAALIDPQERLFLQTAYHTIENAGYTPKGLDEKGRVGVFTGVMWGHYQLYAPNEEARYPNSPYWSIANRVSYTFDLHGPSMAVDTACSSSLSAIHLACESLRNQECKVAIAGGVNLSLHPNKYLVLSQNRFTSTDGRCRSFGEGGDGYVPGEGVGAVLLKPLSAAIADNDRILGIIKGSSLNHGGKTNGYTVPNPKAQSEVIKETLKRAAVEPESISYIEAHGTGTSLGDPIEITGLSSALNELGENRQRCAIGSAKSNIGHLEAAAGIAGLTKVLLQLRHNQLAPSLHSAKLNPNLDLANTPFYVPQNLEPWTGKDEQTPRRAGLSSFGAGGANAHLIIEEYPEPIHTAQDSPQIVPLSARKPEQLRQKVEALIAQPGSDPLEQIAYTLQTGREAMGERIAIVADSTP